MNSLASKGFSNSLMAIINFVKILIKKKVPRQVFLIPRRLRGEKVPNVGPSHLICEMQIKR
jgi:hypothetical protein